MLTERRYWTLPFDGRDFSLERGSSPRPSAKSQVIEAGLETILVHWGNTLLGGPKLQMLGYSGPLTREQDLLAVDELGLLLGPGSALARLRAGRLSSMSQSNHPISASVIQPPPLPSP